MSQLKIKNGNNWESIPAGGIGVPSGGTTGQVLQKSSNTDYATEWVFKGMSLLWTNSNPGSSFSAQTVPVSLSDYDYIYLEAYGYKTSNDGEARLFAVCETTGQYLVYFPGAINNGGTGAVLFCVRSFTVSSSGVVFNSCYTKRTNESTASSVNNDFCVPYKIYGIKL